MINQILLSWTLLITWTAESNELRAAKSPQQLILSELILFRTYQNSEQSSHQFARPWTLNARTDKKFEEDNIDSEMEIGSGSKCFKEKYKW